MTSLTEEAAALAALQSDPSNAESWYVVGRHALDRGDLPTAENAFRCLHALMPSSDDVLHALGEVLFQLGNVDETRRVARLLAKSPDLGEVQQLFVAQVAIQLAETPDQEADGMRRLSELVSSSDTSMDGVKSALSMLVANGAVEEAKEAVKLALIKNHEPVEFAGVYAEVLTQFKYVSEAKAAWLYVLDLQPENESGLLGMAQCFARTGDYKISLKFLDALLAINPENVKARWYRVDIYISSRRNSDALAEVQSDRLQKDNPERAAFIKKRMKLQLSDWEDLPADNFESAEWKLAGANMPFSLLVMKDDPQICLEAAKTSADHWLVRDSKRHLAKERADRSRIRVGFFGSDFHDHATMYLMSGLFREYDRSKFEWYVYDYGVLTHGALASEMRGAVDQYVYCHGLGLAEFQDLTHTHDLDIAVDLKGYTSGGRPDIFAGGLAPVQINYVGYPATMGSPYHHYIIADENVIPPSSRAFFTEKILYMPHCYQPNDNHRPVGFDRRTRTEHGLPEDAFVMACFNTPYKISPREFDIWMSALREHRDAVLWLLVMSEEPIPNLQRAAEARGVDPSRLVFAAVENHTSHLGRIRHADLFVDTFNVNAHTTASDSLWAGLPVLTMRGNQFAARVAGSLCLAVGMDEFVVDTEDAYQALLFRCLEHRDWLSRKREELADEIVSAPLFDTPRYVRHFEALMEAAHQRHLAGLPPGHLRCPDMGAVVEIS